MLWITSHPPSAELSVVPSHLDHDLSMRHLMLVFEMFGNATSFFAESIRLPEELPPLKCYLRGPAVGDTPVPESEVEYVMRPGRAWPHRMVKAESNWCSPVWSREMAVIAGPDDRLGENQVRLYTAYGGPLAPKTPNDPWLKEDEREGSVKFWSEHALVPQP